MYLPDTYARCHGYRQQTTRVKRIKLQITALECLSNGDFKAAALIRFHLEHAKPHGIGAPDGDGDSDADAVAVAKMMMKMEAIWAQVERVAGRRRFVFFSRIRCPNGQWHHNRHH